MKVSVVEPYLEVAVTVAVMLELDSAELYNVEEDEAVELDCSVVVAD